MAFIKYNPNPDNNLVGDCVIRGICILTGKSWEKVYIPLCLEGLQLHDMPSSNRVWSSYLTKRGFTKSVIPNCPDCYSVRVFCRDHPEGTYLLCTVTHVIGCIDGDYYDTWDSGDESPMYYFK